MNKGIKKGLLLFAGCCMAAGLPDKALAASYNDDTADSYLSRISSGAEELAQDWISEGGAEDVYNGPGAAQAALAEDSALAGPKIHEVSMGEKYHSDYDLYEHSIDGKYFIYSNVSNGGITDRPVYVEIPVDVFCTAEKDGVPMDYVSGQMLSARGTYVMRLTAVYDKNVPLSQQEEYRTVFRFRIDEKRQDASGAVSGAAGALTRQIDGLTGSDTAGILNQIASESGLAGDDIAAALADQLFSESGKVKEAGEGSLDGMQTEAGNTDETQESALGQDEDSGQEGSGQGEDSSREGSGQESDSGQEDREASGRSQVYLEDEKMYLVTLENGFTFRSSVPEGMLINQSVAIYPGEGEYTLYRGEEEVSLNERQETAEYGSYRLVSGDYEFTFEINNTYVNRDTFTAPKGTRISTASFNGNTLDTGEGRLLTMEADGSYLVTLKGDYGEILEVELNRDTEPPAVEVRIEGQTAQISYASKDLASVTLSKNGGEPREFNGFTITETGNYILTVTDRAGNQTLKEFSLRYKINMYGVVAIAAVVTAAAAGAVILIRKKRNLTVR